MNYECDTYSPNGLKCGSTVSRDLNIDHLSLNGANCIRNTVDDKFRGDTVSSQIVNESELHLVEVI